MNLLRVGYAGWAPGLSGALVLGVALVLVGCGEQSGTEAVPEGGTPAGSDATVHEVVMAEAASVNLHAFRRHRQADLDRFVVVGDSLGATQNSCMLAEQTVNLYPSLIAEQAGGDAAGVEMPVPLVTAPGFPPCLVLQGDAVVPSAPLEDAGWRDPATIGQPVHNLSVPGTLVRGAYDPAANAAFFANPDLLDGEYPWLLTHHLVLGLSVPPGWSDPPQTMVEWAIRLDPTLLIVWLGANDVLWSAIAADPQFITGYDDGRVDIRVFARQYVRLMATLRLHTDADIVVANIPDVTVIPYLTPVEVVLAGVSEATGIPVAHLYALLGLAPGDYLTPDGPDAVLAVLTGTLPALPDNVVFTAEEVRVTQEATEAFNAVIGLTAWIMRAPVVDTHALLDAVDAAGYAVGGATITTDFLGGVFSLDGIHPTNTGHAVLANEFIRVLNHRLHTEIPPVDVEAVYAEDPLIVP